MSLGLSTYEINSDIFLLIFMWEGRVKEKEKERAKKRERKSKGRTRRTMKKWRYFFVIYYHQDLLIVFFVIYGIHYDKISDYTNIYECTWYCGTETHYYTGICIACTAQHYKLWRVFAQLAYLRKGKARRGYDKGNQERRCVDIQVLIFITLEHHHLPVCAWHDINIDEH